LQAAKENAEKYHKIKADERMQRDQEKLQFSPMNAKNLAAGTTATSGPNIAINPTEPGFNPTSPSNT